MTKPSKPSKQTAAKGAPAAKAGAPGAKDKPKKALTPDARKVQSKKIVNQRQTPWGLIITTIVIVALAAGVIGYAVSRGGSKSDTASSTSAADKIVGIQHYSNLSSTHVAGVVSYPQSPPVGGNHSPIWADCTGTVYPDQIANENAVHDLEHGAVWITYKPGLAASEVDALTKLVAGQQYMIMTPYAGLKTNVSLQAWGYQLFVDNASDARITEFITDLRLNQKNTPELGASCDNPTFKTTPSTPGHPTES